MYVKKMKLSDMMINKYLFNIKVYASYKHNMHFQI